MYNALARVVDDEFQWIYISTENIRCFYPATKILRILIKDLESDGKQTKRHYPKWTKRARTKVVSKAKPKTALQTKLNKARQNKPSAKVQQKKARWRAKKVK